MIGNADWMISPKKIRIEKERHLEKQKKLENKQKHFGVKRVLLWKKKQKIKKNKK